MQRYEEIPVQTCDRQCPGQERELLKFILFEADEKLRNHTVKHFLNLSETSWKGILTADKFLIRHCISGLDNLGCPLPGFGQGHENSSCRNCAEYDECTNILTGLEKLYLEAVKEVIKQGCALPRYTCFLSDKENTYVFCTVSNHKIVAKARLQNNIYNLMTCYHQTGFSLNEVIERQVRKIRNEAYKKRNIVWCEEKNWRIHRKKGKIGKGRKAKRKKPYSRGGSKSFRKYFEDDNTE